MGDDRGGRGVRRRARSIYERAGRPLAVRRCRKQVSIRPCTGAARAALPGAASISAQRPPSRCINFWGNQSVTSDPEIRLSGRWIANDTHRGVRGIPPARRRGSGGRGGQLRPGCRSSGVLDATSAMASTTSLVTIGSGFSDSSTSTGRENLVSGVADPRNHTSIEMGRIWIDPT
jgi:hypothetical protein